MDQWPFWDPERCFPGSFLTMGDKASCSAPVAPTPASHVSVEGLFPYATPHAGESTDYQRAGTRYGAGRSQLRTDRRQ